ncbi:7206_t:CDS:10, partial [Ambispora gerdemannii]
DYKDGENVLVAPKAETYGSDIEFEDGDEEADDLDIKNLSTKAWLVKLPTFLAKKWSEIEQEDVDLGCVRIHDPGKIELILSDNKIYADMPREYDLEITNTDVKDSYSFFLKRDENGMETGPVAMQATVHHNCHIKPYASDEYRQKVRQRTIEAAQPKRTVRVMNPDQNRGAYVPPGLQVSPADNFGKLVQKKPKIPMEQKTTRMPENELIDLLFQAFEEYAYWTLRGLKDYVKQPESYLKEILTRIAILDKRGPYNNCYHLKSEYKRENEPTNDSIAPNGLEPPNAQQALEDENDVLQIQALGAGNELDAGVHPAFNGLAALPFYDEIDPTTVDVLLVSHFHLDHAASLPYFMEKTGFRGRVFMTHPTKAIYKWLLTDFIRVSNVGADENIYTEQDLLHSYEKIEAVDYHQEMEVEGIKFTSYNAGHVLGAAMFLIEIAGVKILYTGDYSREDDRHLMAAEPPKIQPDVLITESTYGVQSHQPRLEKEARFTSLVHDIVQRGGRCLMPVFALGRAQELLLILDEYWEAHPELESVPIYYASSLAKKCMAVYQTYINMMNAKIRKQFAISNPFVFKHISNLKNMDNFDDVGPCVMMASPGMLQSGLSRELFERWAPDKRNGLVITGYCVDGTLARHAMTEPAEITSISGAKIPRRLSVEYISFSAHVDYTQNSQFIDEVNAPNIVLVHGESNAMGRLKSTLETKFKDRGQKVQVFSPKNCEFVRLKFRGEKLAKLPMTFYVGIEKELELLEAFKNVTGCTIGSLAAKYPQEDQLLSGILVSKDFQFNIMDARELKEFSGISTSAISQKQTIYYRASFSLLKFHLEQMFVNLDETKDENGAPTLKILDSIKVKHVNENQILLEWQGNSMNDIIADAVLAVILNIESSPASVKVTKSPTHSHRHHQEDIRSATINFLKKQFGEVFEDPESEDEIVVKVDEHTATVNIQTLEINTQHEPLRKRLVDVIERVARTLRPLDFEILSKMKVSP